MHFSYKISFVATIVFLLIPGYEPLQHHDKLNHTENSTSDFCQPNPVDCADIFASGFKKNGIYNVYPKNRITTCKIFGVYCDMTTDGGGWTVIQRRGDFKKPTDYFYKTWNEYKNGFGGLLRDFWLGNDVMHILTHQKRYSVRFDLGTDKEEAYAVYENFWVDNEENKYRIHITGYSGTAGDAMAYHNTMAFTTKDRKNTPLGNYHDCAKQDKGAWWYNDCHEANLNAFYLKGTHSRDMYHCAAWNTWKGRRVCLATAEIKIRPIDF